MEDIVERKITYKVEKSRENSNKYILWQYSKTKHGLCYRNVFEGTKSECEEEKEKRN